MGNMASAILTGIIESGIEAPGNLVIYDILPEKLEKFARLGCRIASSEAALAAECDTVVLAIKPQGFPKLLENIKDSLDESKLIISIAAGISIKSINEALGRTHHIIRALPNTPMLLGRGVTALTYRFATEEQYEYASRIFSSCSSVYFVDEDKFHEITCVHSSSPAYVFYFIKSMADSAEAQGIGREQAMRMITETFVGAVRMVEETGLSCDQLIQMVASKGGTTEASLCSFEESGLAQAIDNGMRACTRRSKELGGE